MGSLSAGYVIKQSPAFFVWYTKIAFYTINTFNFSLLRLRYISAYSRNFLSLKSLPL